MYVCLSANKQGISLFQVDKEGKYHKPIYFINKVWQGPKVQYQKIEKVAYALVITTRRSRPYV